MAELADAQDLKSCGTYLPYRFDSGRRHSNKKLQVLLFKEFGAFYLFEVMKYSYYSLGGNRDDDKQETAR